MCVHRLSKILLLLVLALGLQACNQTTVRGNTFAFTLPDLAGNLISESDARFEGKVLLVDLWGAWCPPCHEQIPHLVRLYDTYNDQGFDVVGIDFEMAALGTDEERRNRLRVFSEEQGIGYTMLMGGEVRDIEAVLPSLRNVQGFPTTILIGRDGKVRSVHAGFAEAEVGELEESIRRLLGES